MGLERHNLVHNFKRLNIIQPAVKGGIRRFGFSGTIGTLTYRLASQIYQEEDEGYFSEFSDEEMAEHFDTGEEVVEYAREHRGEIAPVIVDTLRTIYPRRKNNKPYRTSKDVLVRGR